MGRLVRTIKGSPRFAQSGHQRGPGLPTCLIQLPKFFFGLVSIGAHALCDRLDFCPTLCGDAFGSGVKLVGGIAPSLQLSISLALEDRLLLLDLLTEACSFSVSSFYALGFVGAQNTIAVEVSLTRRPGSQIDMNQGAGPGAEDRGPCGRCYARRSSPA